MPILLEIVAAEALDVLSADGVDAVLLTGPAIARRLYDRPEQRPYGDVDLLVPPDSLGIAESVLAGVGFVREGTAEDEPRTLVRGGEVVQLHVRLDGVGADPRRQWELLSRHVDELDLAGRAHPVLAPAAQAFVVALAAAAKGAYAEKAMTDLELALERVPAEEWRQAAALARSLGAADELAAGLRLREPGPALASRLRLPEEPPAHVLLRATARPGVREPALALERLRSTRGWGRRARLLALGLFPPPSVLRAVSPLARRGRAGLTVAYGANLARLARHGLPALAAWRAAARRGGRRR